MLLSKTPAKTETFGQNLNTLEEKENKYIYRYAVYLNHGKCLSNADPDLNEIMSDRQIGQKNNTNRRICIPLFTPVESPDLTCQKQTLRKSRH